MKPGEFVNINGKIIAASDAAISVFDRGFLYGDSIYEELRSVNGVFLFLADHLNRLRESARLISMPIDLSDDALTKALNETREASGHDDVSARLIVTRGVGEMGLDPYLATQNTTVMIVRPWVPHPSWWFEKGVHFIVASTQSLDAKSLHPNSKTGNALNAILAYTEAREKGAFDAFMTNRYGILTEGTTSSLWIVKDGSVITPPPSIGLFNGITRQRVLNLLKENGIPHHEHNFNVTELVKSDECFTTSTLRDVLPVTMVNGKRIGQGTPGPMTRIILDLYRAEIGTKMMRRQ